MPEKRVLPLNNPVSEKSPKPVDVDVNGIKNGITGEDKGGKEVFKKPSGGVNMTEALLKCPRCGRIHKLVFRFGTPPNWERCTWCNELQPTDGYKVIAYGLGLPQPKAKHEVASGPYFLAEAGRETRNPPGIRSQ